MKNKRYILILGLFLSFGFFPKTVFAQNQHDYLFKVQGQAHKFCLRESATITFKDNNGNSTWNLDYQTGGGPFSEKEPIEVSLRGPIPDTLKNSTKVEFCLQQKTASNLEISESQCKIYPLENSWFEKNSLVFNFKREPIKNISPEITNANPSSEVQPGDLAEYSYSENPLEGGDIVAIQTIGKDRIIKTEEEYESKITGVISTNPAILLNKLGINNAPTSFFAVTGVGKVPTKVSNINGPIKAGDFITSSSVPGTGMKATQAGIAVGKALEAFDESQANTCPDNPKYKCGQILLQINVSWYEPLIPLSSSGDLIIKGATYSGMLSLNYKTIIDENSYKLINQANNEEEISRVGAFAETVSAKIRAGFIKTVNLVADNIIVNKKLTAPEIEVAKLTADGAKLTRVNSDYISPLSGNDLVIDLTSEGTMNPPSGEAGNEQGTVSEGFGKLLVKGNGEFTGNVGIGATLETRDATISGELYAESARIKKLRAESIEGLEGIFATLSAQYITNVTKVYNDGDNISGMEEEVSTPSTDLDLTDSSLATDSSELEAMASSWKITNPSDDVKIESDSIKIESNVSILGVTSLAQTIISGPLTQDGTLLVDNGNSINVLGGTLYLQNQGGGLDLLAGKVTIDPLGNTVFEGNLTVKATLIAGLVKPLDGGDLTIDLSHNNATDSSEPASVGFGRLLARGANGETVFSLDASGSAEFSGEVAASSFKIARDAVAAEPDIYGTIEATSSAGLAKIPAQSYEVTIQSPYVKEKSLIYLTPIGSTGNQVIYLARTNPEAQTFTAAIDRILTKDVLFSWWIVN